MSALEKTILFSFLLLSLAVGSINAQEDGNTLYYFNTETMETIEGTVADFDSLLFYDGTESFTHILLSSPNGEITFVVLGPEYHLESNNITFSKGDRVRVSGSRVGEGEKTFIIATSVMKGNQHLELRDEEGIPLWLDEYMRLQ
ncbi:MAG: hypothetical protein ACLFQB_09985 [Chitinispirillaceae bacterium]